MQTSKNQIVTPKRHLPSLLGVLSLKMNYCACLLGRFGYFPCAPEKLIILDFKKLYYVVVCLTCIN